MSLPNLWAPWRLEYIKRQDDVKKNCPFCELPQGEPSEENLILFKNDELFVILNKFPYNPNHLLVVPIAHVSDPSQLSPSTWAALATAIQAAIAVLQAEIQPHGFNVGLNLGAGAGAGLPDHLHWHIVPRWNGDTNFMPILAETKAIPTHNLTVYRQLQKVFADFGARLSK